MYSALDANELHFACIEKLVEQQVGIIVVPEIFQKLDIEITITPYPGERAQREAITGRKDGEIMRIFSYGLENPEMIRVPTPYYYLETMAFVEKGSGVSIRTREDLSRYSVGKVLGVKHTNNITEGMTNVRDFNSTEEMMKLVDAGRLDIALTNTTDGLTVIKEKRYTSITAINTPLATLDLYLYVHEKHAELVPLIDSVIVEMTASGELEKLIREAETLIIEEKTVTPR